MLALLLLTGCSGIWGFLSGRTMNQTSTVDTFHFDTFDRRDTADSDPCGEISTKPTLDLVDGFCGPDATQVVTVACADGAMSLTAATFGLSSGGELVLHQTGLEGAAPETHPVALTDQDEGGWWSLLTVQVEAGAEATDPGVASVYDCSTVTQSTLTWVLTVNDLDGGKSDCGAWGHDPDTVAPTCRDL
jgi:hypothetical protein